MSTKGRRQASVSALLLIFLLAVSLRIALILAMPNVDTSDRLDSYKYALIAHNLISGQGFTQFGEPALTRGPLYPAFIAGCYLVFGESSLAVKIVQAIVGALVPLVMYRLMLLYWTRRLAVFGAILGAIDVQLIGVGAYRYSETLYTLLSLVAIWMILISVKKKSLWGMAASGVVLGLSALTRPQTLALPLVAILAFALMRIPVKRCLLWGGTLALTMSLVVAPWTIRNYNVSGHFLAVSTGFGYVLWVGNYLPLDGRDRYAISRIAAAKIAANMDAVQRDSRLAKEAIRGIRENPVPSAWLMFRKTGRFWFDVYANSPNGRAVTRNKLIVLVFAVWNSAIVLFAFLGLVCSRSKLRDLSLILSLVLLTMVTGVLTIPIARYRLPIMPFVSMFAVVGICWLWQRAFGLNQTNGNRYQPESLEPATKC